MITNNKTFEIFNEWFTEEFQIIEQEENVAEEQMLLEENTEPSFIVRVNRFLGKLQ